MRELSPEQQGVRKDALRSRPQLQQLVKAIFGADEDDVEAVRERARRLIPDCQVIVWEADPLTFTFTYVSPEAEQLLGHPEQRWRQPDFWRAEIVHPDDVGDAVSHCAIATAAGIDHDFEYRARTVGGDFLRVHDVVHVLKGPLGFVSCLRGIMLPVDDVTY